MRTPSALLTHSNGTTPAIACALEDAGYQVTAVKRPSVAVARLASGDFDCLVSVPEGTEPPVLTAVRELETTPPIVVCANGTDELAKDVIDRVVARDRVEQIVDAVEEVTTSRREPRQAVAGHDLDPETIVRAIDDAPVGISLSDASLPDTPLVYVNDAWTEITGYSRAEALDRNPRFLQGPGTDGATSDALSKALANGTSVTTEIRNYRQDGTPFWNELTITPITDGGEVTHYVGVQNDITERKRAERIAQERAETLAKERARLRRLLERINGLLAEVTTILGTERDRRAIAQQVCGTIVATEGYVGAWIGSAPPSRADLELWGATGLPAEVDSLQALAALPAAVHSALEEKTVETCVVGDCDGAVLGPAVVGAEGLTVVPIGHGQTCEALWCVYGDEQALDHRHRQLFTAIGRTIATRLNAIDASESLMTDQGLEIEVEVADSAFPLVNVASALETELTSVGLTGLSDGETAELIVTVDTTVSAADLAALPAVVDARAIAETNGESTVALTLPAQTPFVDLGERGIAIVAIEATPHRAVFQLELPSATDVRSVLECLECLYERVSLLTRRERDHRPQTVNECTSVLKSRLTDRQRTALKSAYRHGYFEWPRPTDGTEVAASMDITRQTFHQHLRAAERKLVETVLEPTVDS